MRLIAARTTQAWFYCVYIFGSPFRAGWGLVLLDDDDDMVYNSNDDLMALEVLKGKKWRRID